MDSEGSRLQVSMLEKPSYQVLKTVRAGRFKAEIRHYEPYLIAESTVTEKTMRDGTSKGFMNVASFIFGENIPRVKPSAEGAASYEHGKEKVAMTAPVRVETKQKVAMTSPVRTELNANLGNMKVSFVMPRKYNQGTLPKPKGKSVKIKTVPGHKMVAVRFRGPAVREAEVAKMSRTLFEALEAEGLTPKGDLMVYQYHPPFMPGFLRRNEVAVKV